MVARQLSNTQQDKSIASSSGALTGDNMSSEDIATRVRSWIEKTGLPLELETTSTLNKAGFDSNHSYIYEDPESQKGREIDVVGRTTDVTGLIQVYVVAECKASSKPWIVLANKSQRFGATYAALGISTRKALDAIDIDSFTQGKLARHLKSWDTGGYALKQAFSEDVDNAYAATMSALKAASVLAEHQEGPTEDFVFALPVLVVDAPIFECIANESGDLELKEVPFSQFMFTALIPERKRAIVRIAHRQALPHFASHLYDLAAILKEELNYKVDEYMEEIQRRNSPE